MKTLIVYDSVFGNTGKIAREIYHSLSNKNGLLCQANDVKTKDLKGIALLIVGSPTRGFRPTENITRFLKHLPNNSLSGVKVAAFDTRFSLPDLNSSFIKFIVKTGGYAANTIANKLRKHGGELIVPPEGFLVIGEQGPLKKGEPERARNWVNTILCSCEN